MHSSNIVGASLNAARALEATEQFRGPGERPKLLQIVGEGANQIDGPTIRIPKNGKPQPIPGFREPDEAALVSRARLRRDGSTEYSSDYQDFIWQALSQTVRAGKVPTIPVRGGSRAHAQTMFVVSGRVANLLVLQ